MLKHYIHSGIGPLCLLVEEVKPDRPNWPERVAQVNIPDEALPQIVRECLRRLVHSPHFDGATYDVLWDIIQNFKRPEV